MRSSPMVRWATLILAQGLTLSAHAGEASGFEVRGEVRAFGFGPAPHVEWRFELVVARERWDMKLEPLAQPDARVVVRRVVSDGTTLYACSRYKGGEIEGLVLPLSVPNFDPCLGTLWLAYCSAKALAQSPPTDLPPPVTEFVFGGAPTGGWIAPGLEGRLQAWWTLHELPPGLPRHFWMKDPGELRLPHQLGLAHTGIPHAPPYNRGFTNLVFHGEAWWKIAHMEIPRVAWLEILALQDSGPGPMGRTAGGSLVGPPAPRLRVEIQADRAVPFQGEVTFPPLLPGEGRVHDWRFASADGRPMGVVYWATNRWLERSEIMQLPEYQQIIATWAHQRSLHERITAEPSMTGGQPRSGRGVALAILLFSVLAAIPLYLALRRKERTDTS
ncbi:MAG: hypothetical protein WHT82_00140 [Limisphaera sp.]